MAKHDYMATASHRSPTPQNESLSLEFPLMISQVVDIIGHKLTAYVAGAHEDMVIKWVAGEITPAPEVEAKLRFVFRVVKPLKENFGPGVAQAWLQGSNPELNDFAAIDLIRDENLHSVQSDILSAENIFLEYQL